MDRKKRHPILKTILVLLIMLLAAGTAYLAADYRADGEISIQDIQDTVFRLFHMEPAEIRELRQREVVQSEEGHLEYYFHSMNEEEQRIYREMEDGIRDRKGSFYLTSADTDVISRVYEAVLNDHPEFYWVRNREHKTTTSREGENFCVFAPGYTYTQEEMREIDASIEQAWQEVSGMIPAGAGEYEITKIVYTYLIDLVDYEASEHDQNIAGAFWQKKAVCAGYSAAVQYLLERFSINCIYVAGDALDSDAGHAWNIVEIDGQYYIVDATNGDQPEFLEGDFVQLAEHKTTLYDYLCPFPDEYAMTYTPSDLFDVPECTARDKNFYVLNGACFGNYNWQDVYDLCTSRIDNSAAVIRFKFSTQEAFDSAYGAWAAGDSPGEVAQYYMEVHDMDYVEYHRGVLEDFKTIYYIF